LGALFMAYELMRGYTAAGVGTVHSEEVLAAERWLFLGWLPTQVLQDAFHVPGATDPLAMAATAFYFLHFALPFAVGLLLWTRRRESFHEFIGGLIVLSIAGFATYLVLPVAPPWYAAEHGTLVTGAGEPAVQYLKIQGFGDLAALLGLDGSAALRFAMHDVNPNLVGAFPSLHAGYPMLAFILLRRSFGRRAWLMLAYAAAVWLSVVYLADHYVVDIIGGVAYACVAAWLVTRLRARSVPGG
jgi:membrane-associated phospholipid phosphatase